MEGRKAALRRILLERRRDNPEVLRQRWSDDVCRNILRSPYYREADTVLLYIPVKGEIDLTAVLEAALAAGKQVGAPRCGEGGAMDFYLIRSRQDLAPGAYGIPEPVPSCPKACPTAKTLCLVPGIAFDRKGGRLGYGGGYYDRWLAGFPGMTAGACGIQFVLEQLPTGQQDIPVKAIVTENGWLEAEK